jgi:predicted enzyme related to lactoylglutathione lyase
MKTSGLIEVILYVQDMDAQVAFYRDNFGLRVLFPAEETDYDQEYWVTFATGACTLALRLGQDTPKIVFGVADIDAARSDLLSRGVKVGEVRPAAPGVWVCDGFDPEGNPFSIESHD